MKVDYVHKDSLTATDYVELNKNNELLISYNQALLKENQELKQINEEHKKLNGDLRKENQEIRLDQTKKVFHVLTHVLLNGGCSYRYLIYDLLDFKLENYSDLIEGMNIVNAIATLEEVKKQLEERTKMYLNACKYAQGMENEVITLNTQQKEFIKWLEDYLKLFDTMDIEEQASYDTIEEILQKYKEIIGVLDEIN